MTQFEDLLPYIRGRVAEVEVVGLGNHIARFDNDVYFRMMRFPSQFAFRDDPARLFFTISPAADGSTLTPSLDAVGRVAASSWLGVRHRPLSGISGPQTRANLQRIRLALGARRASMSVQEAGPNAKYDPWHPKPWESGDPRRWLQTEFDVRPPGFLGSGRYDWPSLGGRILGALEDIRSTFTTDYRR